MKTLIVFSSKYGGTEKIAQSLMEMLNEDVDLVSLADQSDIQIAGYDNIIIGTPIYAGKARQEVRKFCKNNQNTLLNKNTGIFISCWFSEKVDEYIKDSFPAPLVENSKIVYGGIDANPSEMSFIDKMAVKFIAKIKQPVSDIKKKNLKKLAQYIMKQ